ncbi:hypothetical protein BN2497_3131 [Janthinobacterium sp. CG23_2]|nr:hypothetical protein BN2497_3131 [Janthinobacterium sp. CG23_2]CUU27963.1 hypothetical protein BN3177_3131 [Janthinobacterium sp. CG23_2]
MFWGRLAAADRGGDCLQRAGGRAYGAGSLDWDNAYSS